MTGWANGFLQELAISLGIVATVLAIARRREVITFFSSHAQKWHRIQTLESENAQLRGSLAASTLANEGWEGRVEQLSDEVREMRTTIDDIKRDFNTLSAKFVVGVAFIASQVAHVDTSILPALIKEDVEIELRRQVHKRDQPIL